MTDYLIMKKSTMDALAYSGYILSEEDKIMNIPGGVGVEYDSFVVPITSMPGTFSMPEITALLLTREARIEQHSQTEMLSVNLASNNQGFNQNKRGNTGIQSGSGRGNFEGNFGQNQVLDCM